MPKGPANLGYFVSKDQTIQNADKYEHIVEIIRHILLKPLILSICVLVIHYDFKEAKAQLAELPQVTQDEIDEMGEWNREGDAKDLENLIETFRENRNCNFHSILSPKKEDLKELLSKQEILLEKFGCSDVPSVFVLYILSHGDRDGEIYTDHFKDNACHIVEKKGASRGDDTLKLRELFVSFTTTEIFENLKKLTGFDDCLKCINFGPCRGELIDVKITENDTINPYNNENSCRITYSPQMRNTVVFFSTVETTKSKRSTSKGSNFVRLTCEVFNSLKEDENLINVLTTIQNESHKENDIIDNIFAGQTPEVKMFSQDRSFVISKSPSNNSTSSTSDVVGTKIKKKREFYSWKSSSGEDLRHRLAFLYSAEQNNQLNELKRVLSENLHFQTSEPPSKLDSDFGCIFLIFLGTVSEDKKTNEVCLQVNRKENAISKQLLRLIGPKHDQWIGKPKILFIVNQEKSASDDIGLKETKDKITVPTNHSGWLVLVLHNKDELQKLIEIFKGQELKREKSLQELLESLLISESSENRDFLNSTLQYLLNFPDPFVELTFSLTMPNKTRKNDVSFGCLVKESASKKQIWLLSSVAGTGKTTILREMAFQLGKLNPELQILRVSLPRVSFSSLKWNVTETEFLVKATHNSQEEIKKTIENKQCVVILDGFDEITRPDNQEKTLRVIKTLEEKQVSVWIGTRPNAAEAIKKRISNAFLVEIDPLDEEQQIELFQLETGKSREECEQFIKNFKSEDILENPLHLSLVAKYGAEGNLYQIYDKVVRHKVEDSLNRKAVDKKRFEFGEIFADGLKDLQKLSSDHIRGNELTDYTKDDLEKNNYYGIASFQNNKVIFIHQTFAEFLAAQYFVSSIDDFLTDTAKLFFGQSFSWCRKFVDLFYSTVLNDVEKIEKRRASILRVMKLDPDIFLGLIASDGCINIFKMVYPIISFSEKQEGNCIAVAKDRTLLVKAIRGAEEIAIMMLDMDLINSDVELLIILPHLLYLVAETNACLFFKKLETKFPTLPEMIHSRRSIIEAGVVAARNDHGEILHLLLQSGVDKDFHGDENNALFWAIATGGIKCVEVLLKHGAKLAIYEDGDSWDPLLLAVEEDHLDMVKFLLEENISGLQRNKDTLDINEVKSCLNSAIRHGHKEIAKFLIEKCPSFKNAEYGDDESLLQFSATNGCLEMCQWLVDEEGVDVNTLRRSGEPRDWSSDDNIFMDHFLILQKSDINMTDERGKTALHCAAEHGYLERVQELIHSGANVRAVDENGWNAFHFACKSDREHKEDMFRLLHSTDSQLAKEKTGSGQTGLHILLKFTYCSDNNVRFLVEVIGVDVRAKDNNGCTALRIAVDKGRDCVEYLMTKDIDLEVKNYCGRTCLHAAAERGDLEALQAWIELGGDLNVVDEGGMTALHIAAERGHLQFVNKFLACATKEVQNQDIGEGCVGSKLKERLNRSDNEGRTALHLAAESGNVDLVKLLPENNADLTQMDREGKNAIHYTINNERMLRFLNEKNGDLLKQRTKDGNTTLHLAIKWKFKVTEEDEHIALWIIGQVDDTVLNAKNDFGDTPLLLACRNRWWRVAELLLTRNVEVNVADWRGKTAMHHAAAEGNLSLVKLLHEKGANLTLRDNEGMNALHHAIRHFEVISFLHEKNNELLGQRSKDGDTTLHLASKTWRIDTDTIRWLVEQCENDLNVTDSEGDTPLLVACKNKKWIIAKILLKKSVDIHVKDTNGRTALHYAVKLTVIEYDKLEYSLAFDLVQELCKRGADLALTDNEGKNAFHHAITNHHMALFIHKLNGNLVKQRCNNGDTTLHLAIKLCGDARDDDILIWLVKQCENVLNLTNSEGETPLLLACKYGMWIIAKILLAKTVDINARDKNGRTALHYAVKLYVFQSLKESPAFGLVQELCKRGADFALTDNEGMNAFHHAIEDFRMALFIHELNGDLVKQRLNNGDTSLHLAIKLNKDKWNDKFVTWLVEQGVVDLNATNALNETPLILACKNWNENNDIVDLLISKNVDVLVKDNEGKCALHYFNKFCPTHLRGSFVDIEEASPSKKMRMS